MAHYAQIIDGKVAQVLVVDADTIAAHPTHFTGEWIQTSYNTILGEHSLGGTPLRKNFAGVGYTYDRERDAFIAPQPYESWLLDEDTCSWNAPVEMPTDGKRYDWDEDTTSWVTSTSN
jgi:hypothetical protein